jgi:hypothetical protein
LVAKRERKTTLERHRHSWEDNMKKNLRELWSKSVDWTELAQDADQWQTFDDEPCGSIKAVNYLTS